MICHHHLLARCFLKDFFFGIFSLITSKRLVVDCGFCTLGDPPDPQFLMYSSLLCSLPRQQKLSNNVRKPPKKKLNTSRKQKIQKPNVLATTLISGLVAIFCFCFFEFWRVPQSFSHGRTWKPRFRDDHRYRCDNEFTDVRGGRNKYNTKILSTYWNE